MKNIERFEKWLCEYVKVNFPENMEMDRLMLKTSMRTAYAMGYMDAKDKMVKENEKK